MNSAIPEIGKIDEFLRKAGERERLEHKLHKSKISIERVKRGKKEKNENLRYDAEKCFDLMPGYCDFWGYNK